MVSALFRRRQSRRRERPVDRLVVLVCYALLSVYVLLIVAPVMTVIAIAISEEQYVLGGLVGLFPRGIQTRSLRAVLSSSQFMSSLAVSVFVTAVGSLGSIALTSITAFCLSKKHLPLIKPVLVLYIFVMLFDGGIVPNYLLVRSLGMLNTPWALIVPRILSVFYLLILKSYFEALPDSIEESAQLDGASNLRIVFSILMPVALPALGTIGLFYAVDYWNAFFDALMYITRPALKPLQLYLREVVRAASQITTATLGLDSDQLIAPESVRSAAVILSMIPMVVLYPWLQRYFAKGAMLGSVKG